MQDFLGKWGKEGVVNFIEEMSELIICTASRTLLGGFLASPTLVLACQSGQCQLLYDLEKAQDNKRQGALERPGCSQCPYSDIALC